MRSLERRLLEHERANTNNNVENSANLAASNANKNSTVNTNGSSNNNSKSAVETVNTHLGRPEVLVRALQIMEVREQLERDRAGGNVSSMSPEHMDDGEKALLREMCNVVWRKLEENPNNQDV